MNGNGRNSQSQDFRRTIDSSPQGLVPNIPGLFSLLPKPSKSACCSGRPDKRPATVGMRPGLGLLKVTKNIILRSSLPNGRLPSTESRVARQTTLGLLTVCPETPGTIRIPTAPERRSCVDCYRRPVRRLTGRSVERWCT
jgi:hypothetical protein